MSFPPLDFSPHIDRRKRLQAMMRELGGGIAILPAAPRVLRNPDFYYTYRQNSNFLYLSGFPEPQAYLVLIAGDQDRAILFCREKDAARERWDGPCFGPQAAATHFGFDEAHSVEYLAKLLPDMLRDQPTLFIPPPPNGQLPKPLRRALKHAYLSRRSGRPLPQRQYNVLEIVEEMRLIKDESEIATLRRAAQISAGAHLRAMRQVRPGQHEYEIEAELLYEFRRQGAQSVAYNSIVASGQNACTLHHEAGDAILADHDLVLVDAGCELDGYAADITRTFPVNGRYSGAQRLLYDLTIAAQKAAWGATRVGQPFDAGHHAAVRVLAQGMIDVKLLSGSLEDVLASRAYQRFYMHRTSHWLGIDVHDVGNYFDPAASGPDRPARTLEKNMVLTLEPGIYVSPADDIPQKFWGIGIRTEDDALVTDDGCELMSRGVPVEATEIEAWMRDIT